MPSRFLSLPCLALLAAPALADSAPRSIPRPDPTDAAAPTRPLDFQSSFEGYRPFAPVTTAPWRASNQAVGAPAAPDRSVETAPAPAPAGGHAGHKH